MKNKQKTSPNKPVKDYMTAYEILKDIDINNITMEDVKLYKEILYGVDFLLNGPMGRSSARRAKLNALGLVLSDTAYSIGIAASLNAGNMPVTSFVLAGVWTLYFGGRVFHYTYREYARVKKFLATYGMDFGQYMKLRRNKKLNEAMYDCCFEDLIKHDPFPEMIENPFANYGGYTLTTVKMSENGAEIVSQKTFDDKGDLMASFQDLARQVSSEKTARSMRNPNKKDDDDDQPDNEK